MSTSVRSSLVPQSVKLLYSAFVAVLVPYYLHAYGPTNFLYFCDIALLVTVVALWREWSLPASAALVGILIPQLLWMADFLASLAGHPITGMTAYMFDGGIPLFTRGLSFFHFWLPLFLLWLVYRLGYDRRALQVWTLAAWVLLLVCYFFMPGPPAPSDHPTLPVNINYVYGPSDTAAQTWMHPLLYLGLLMSGLPLLVFWPTHWLLARLIPAPVNR